MVIVRPVGGLANQMFPYAMGRALALHLNTELLLDTRAFQLYEERTDVSYRKFGLERFNIQGKMLDRDEADSLVPKKPNRIERLKSKLSWKNNQVLYYRERSFEFDPGVFDVKGHVFFDGNWGSWKYFERYADIVRSDFTLREPPGEKNAVLAEMVKAHQSVSLHIRRGDYAHEAKANAVHGLCPLDYYEDALRYLRERLSDPVFFVFSDDIEWAREHLKFEEAAHFVDWNGPLNAHEDMRLMSMCHHHIIANSGFSWWAAWLNPSREKLVIAPQRWFATDKYDTRDLCPPEWILI